QPLEKLDQVVERGDAVVLPAQDQRWRGDHDRVDNGKPGAHVDIGPIGYRVVEREYGVGKGVDHTLLRGLRMITLENRIDEGAVDGAPFLRQELGKLLAPLFECRRAASRPHESIEREARHALGMLLSKQ